MSDKNQREWMEFVGKKLPVFKLSEGKAITEWVERGRIINPKSNKRRKTNNDKKMPEKKPRVTGFFQHVGGENEGPAEELSFYELTETDRKVSFISFSQGKYLIKLGLLTQKKHQDNEEQIERERQRTKQFLEEMERKSQGSL